MYKLDQAVAKLNQAIQEIREITGAAGVRSTFNEELNLRYTVHLLDTAVFDQLAAGRVVTTRGTGGVDFPAEDSFTVGGVQFITLRCS